MNLNFHDPAISISIGVIFIGVAFLIWAVGKLRQKSSTTDSPDFLSNSEPTPTPADEFFGAGRRDEPEPMRAPEPEISFTPPARSTPPPARQEPVTPAVNREMVDRLDSMSQRLTEMQNVLQRQVNNPVGMGTALNAETIDKLLKIIGNVTQQVDILQRSLGAIPTATTAAPAAAPAATAPAATPATPPIKPIETISAASAVTNPQPAPAKAGTGTTPAGKPGVKGPGVAGGALSFPRQSPPTTPAGTPPASNPPGSGK